MDKQTLLLDTAHKAYQYYISRNPNSKISEGEYVDVFMEGHKACDIVNNIQEKLTEKELNRYATSFIAYHGRGAGKYEVSLENRAFKAGFIKALELLNNNKMNTLQDTYNYILQTYGIEMCYEDTDTYSVCDKSDEPIFELITQGKGEVEGDLNTSHFSFIVCVEDSDIQSFDGCLPEDSEKLKASIDYLIKNLDNTKELKIKGQPIQAWKDWIKIELTPPCSISDETKYVLEAFLEGLELLENGRSGFKH